MTDLAGKTIAITGASSGIGMATALVCAQAGMNVAVGARREDKLNALVDQINTQQGARRAVAIRTDVDDPADCRRLIDFTVESFGSIYSVMANAGYGLEKSVQDTTDEELQAIFQTNFFGTMNTLRPAMERMIPAGEGHLIIVTSCLSKLGTPYHSAYSATKAAQDHIARGLRLELAESGIFVSSIHPIGTKTELFEAMDRTSGGSAALHTPEFLMQSPERVARAILRTLRQPRGLLGGSGREVWTSHSTRLLLAFGTAFPGVTDRLLRKHVTRRKKYYRSAIPPPA